MGKRGASEAVGARKTKGKGKTAVGGVATNPFEFKHVRQKHQVLGQRPNAAKGAPGASRKRAEETRRQQLLPQLKGFAKDNKVVDKRLGEGSASLTAAERQTMRLAFAKRRELKKARKFALSDHPDDALTHFGQSLANVQKYERPVGSDDEDDVRGLSSELVSAAHFGGGGEGEVDESGRPLTRKEALAKAILRSKEERSARQKTREEGQETTDALDSQLSALRTEGALGALMLRGKEEGPAPVAKDKAADAYDLLFRSLGVDNRVAGPASKKLPTAAEVAKKAEEEAAAAEEQRLARMHGRDPQAITKPQIIGGVATGVRVVLPAEGSGPTADEDPSLMPLRHAPKAGEEETGFELSYDLEGRPNFELPAKPSSLASSTKPRAAKRPRVSFEGDAGEAKDDAVPAKWHGFKGLLRGGRRGGQGRRRPRQVARLQGSSLASAKPRAAKRPRVSFEGDAGEAKDDAVPAKWHGFKKLLDASPSAAGLRSVLERLGTANAIHLAPANRAHLQRLFRHTLRAYATAQSLDEETRERLNVLVAHIHAFAQKESRFVAESLQPLLERQSAAASTSVAPPSLSLLLLLRLVRTLFPASDYRHPVVTPALILGHQCLRASKAKGPKGLGKELALCGELLSYAAQSRRYSPEILRCLLRVLRRKAPASTGSDAPPAVVVSSLYASESAAPSWASVAGLAVETAARALKLWQHLPSFPDIARELQEPLSRLSTCAALSSVVSSLEAEVETCLAEHRRGPPKGLADRDAQEAVDQAPGFEFLEPRLEANLAPGSKRPLSERQRLKKELREETRGSVRELRRDAAFIAAQRQTEERQKDSARRAKTKALMSSLQGQEAEYQRFQRTKHHKRSK